jgi:hypothetical protein
MNGLVRFNLSRPFPGYRAGIRKVVGHFISFKRISSKNTDHYPSPSDKLIYNTGFQDNNAHGMKAIQYFGKLAIVSYFASARSVKTHHQESPKPVSFRKTFKN